MRTSIIAAAFALALSAHSHASISTESLESVYTAGSQYTAVLQQHNQHWRLTPTEGNDLEVSAASTGCIAGGTLPKGLWLITRDAQGRPQLRAPSSTELPQGFPEEVPLRACGTVSDTGPYVAAPKALIEWLATSSGAVLVDE